MNDDWTLKVRDREVNEDDMWWVGPFAFAIVALDGVLGVVWSFLSLSVC